MDDRCRSRTRSRRIPSYEGVVSRPLAKLADEVNNPHDLYELPQKLHSSKYRQLSPQRSLALFIDRLRILVPQSSADHFRARNCLRSCQERGVISHPLDVELSRESRMLECLVKCYVNVKQRRRPALKRALGQRVGLGVNNVNIFDIFSDLFTKLRRQTRCEEAVAIFVASLRQAHSRKGAFIGLERDLCIHRVAHEPIPVPDDVGIPESDEELVEDIMPVVQEEIRPLLDDHDKKRMSKIRDITRRRMSVFACFCTPVLLGLLLFAVAMVIVWTYLDDKRETVVASSYGQMHCPMPCPELQPAPIYVTNYNTFWYKSVSISQDTDNHLYVPLDIAFYLVPADDLQVYTTVYQYNKSGYGDLVLDQFYALKGSSMNFSLVVENNGTNPENVTLTICKDQAKYTTSNEAACFQHYSVTIDPNATTPLNVRFIAEQNSYYFITTKPTPLHVTVEFFKTVIELRYLNSSDWKGLEPALTMKTSDTAGTQRQLAFNGSLTSMFEAKDYSIVAVLSGDGAYSEMTITKQYQGLVYVVPAMAALCFMLLGITLVSCVCVCYQIITRIVYGRKKGNELREQV